MALALDNPLLSPQSGSHGGPPEGNLHGHVFGHTVRPHLVARFLGAQLESSFAFKFRSFFFLVTQGGCRCASIFAPFWRPLGSILRHFGVFWRPLGVPGGGPWRRDVFSLIFGGQKSCKVEPQRLPKSIQNWFKILLFFVSFLESFWVPK